MTTYTADVTSTGDKTVCRAQRPEPHEKQQHCELRPKQNFKSLKLQVFHLSQQMNFAYSWCDY